MTALAVFFVFDTIRQLIQWDLYNNSVASVDCLYIWRSREKQISNLLLQLQPQKTS